MGKTRDLVKKMRDTKGTLHAKMGTIKDRSGMDLTEKILRRGGKNTQKIYTKMIFTTHIITMVCSLTEPDFLEYEIKWASGSISMQS